MQGFQVYGFRVVRQSSQPTLSSCSVEVSSDNCWVSSPKPELFCGFSTQKPKIQKNALELFGGWAGVKHGVLTKPTPIPQTPNPNTIPKPQTLNPIGAP